MVKQTPPSPFRPTPRVDTLVDFGPRIDAVGDIHGCVDEAVELLGSLGHTVAFPADPNMPATVVPAPGRAIVFLGDLTDRGPRSRDALRLLEGALGSGAGFAVMGNHDSKLLRALAHQPITIAGGLDGTLAALEEVAPETRDRWRAMIHALPHQIRAPAPIGDGWATFVHAAAPSHHQDQPTRNSLNRALYGYADGTTDSHGNLIRDDWAETYTGNRLVVHGHTPLARPRLKNQVACLDTGAVFGGHLAALSIDTLEVRLIASGVLTNARSGFERTSARPGSIERLSLHDCAEPPGVPKGRAPVDFSR